jgi:hypothetical protein
MKYKIITNMSFEQCQEVVKKHNEEIRRDATKLHKAFTEKTGNIGKRIAAASLKKILQAEMKIAKKISEMDWDQIMMMLNEFKDKDTMFIKSDINSQSFLLEIDGYYLEYVKFTKSEKDILSEIKKIFNATNISVIDEGKEGKECI